MVAVALVRREGLRGRPWTALVLPAVETADHRGHVGVPDRLHGLRGERRPDTAGAVDDDRSLLVGELPLDLELELAPRQEDRSRDRSLLVLVGLAHVEQGHLAEQRLHVCG